MISLASVSIFSSISLKERIYLIDCLISDSFLVFGPANYFLFYQDSLNNNGVISISKKFVCIENPCRLIIIKYFRYISTMVQSSMEQAVVLG